MAQATFVKSAAATDKMYQVIQARMIDGTIKFQGIGKKQNREYGVSDACGASCLPDLAAFLTNNE
jgi:hypothetical protein